MEPLPFTIHVLAPEEGESHEKIDCPDRDVIRGGDGDDVLIGNAGLDRLLGGDNGDLFVGEPIECRDFSSVAGDTTVSYDALPPGEGSHRPRTQFEREVDIQDRVLLTAVADHLGLPITQGYDYQPWVGSTILASDLATLTHFSGVGYGNSWSTITSLAGLEYAVNLESLSLSGNWLTDLSALQPAHRNGVSVGMRRLENLSLDYLVDPWAGVIPSFCATGRNRPACAD